MVFTPIHVQTPSKSDTEHSKYVVFNGTKSRIEPEKAILSFKQPLKKSSIPAAISLVSATHMMCNMKQPLSS